MKVLAQTHAEPRKAALRGWNRYSHPEMAKSNVNVNHDKEQLDQTKILWIKGELVVSKNRC